MTNIRSSGFDNPAQLREHLDELEDAQNERRDILSTDIEDQIARLRTEVRELRKLVVQTRTRLPLVSEETRNNRFWLHIAGSVAATFVLSAALCYLRLGPAGAGTVPLLVSKIDGGR